MIGPGEELGYYRILHPLGEGGMGVVYVAEHVKLRRKVAIKVLRQEFSAKAESIGRFFDEAVSVNRIGNEHIVDVTHCDTAPSGEAYFVMEYLQGDCLSTVLRRERQLSLQRTLHIALQLAEALGAAHDAGIVHRDLKPDNIFLINRAHDRDYVKLLDFGIAKLVGDVDSSHQRTRTGAVMGTPSYMSPEQCLGKQRLIDHRTDVYSLGVLLYRMTAGEVPFKGEGWGEVLMMHVSAPFPSVIEARPDLPAEFQDIMLHAVAKNPAERFQNMAQIREALLTLYQPPSYSGMSGQVGVSGSYPPVEGRMPTGSRNPSGSSWTPPSLSQPPSWLSNTGSKSVSDVSGGALQPAPGPSTLTLAAGQVKAVEAPSRKSLLGYVAVGAVAALVAAGAVFFVVMKPPEPAPAPAAVSTAEAPRVAVPAHPVTAAPAHAPTPPAATARPAAQAPTAPVTSAVAAPTPAAPAVVPHPAAPPAAAPTAPAAPAAPESPEPATPTPAPAMAAPAAPAMAPPVKTAAAPHGDLRKKPLVRPRVVARPRRPSPSTSTDVPVPTPRPRNVDKDEVLPIP